MAAFPYLTHPTFLTISSVIIFDLLNYSLSLIMNGREVKHCSLCFHNGEPEEFCR